MSLDKDSLAEDNAFAQPRFFHTLSIHTLYRDLFDITHELDLLEFDYEYFEKDQVAPSLENHDDDIWIIKIYLQSPEELIRTELKLVNIIKNQPIIRGYIENKDWVKETQNNFKPIEIEEFYIHTDNFPDKADKVNLHINPDRAFGTGEHETTKLCLQAISYLASSGVNPSSCADIGCGSGILAIALKKKHPETKIIASDMDNESVKVSISNFEKNEVDIEAYFANGFYHKQIKEKAPYSLIVSNILAKPIISLAEDMNKYSKRDAYVILSGFVDYQKAEILEKYQTQGFKLEKELSLESWICYILKKII